MSSESVRPSNHLILCRPVLLPPSLLPSIRVLFSNESVLCIRWPKYWSFSINPSNEYSGLIYFRIDWFGLLAVQGTESSPAPQFESINSLALSFFMLHLSHPYMTTGKTTALTRRNFLGKVMSLLFNTPRCVMTFLPKSRRLLILWLQSLSAVILGSKKIKSVAVSTLPLSVCCEVLGPDAMVLGF